MYHKHTLFHICLESLIGNALTSDFQGRNFYTRSLLWSSLKNKNYKGLTKEDWAKEGEL